MAVQTVERIHALVSPLQKHVGAANPLANGAARAAIGIPTRPASHVWKRKKIPMTLVTSGGVFAAKMGLVLELQRSGWPEVPLRALLHPLFSSFSPPLGPFLSLLPGTRAD